MTTWHERLQQALNARGKIPADLARYCGVKPPSVSDWLSGKTKMIGGKNAAKVCEFLRINHDWLFDGKPPSGLEDESNAEQAPALGAFRKLGVVGTAQLGDNGYWAELEYPVGHGDGYVEYPSKDPQAYALRCNGDSMKPRIKHGEFVIIEPGHQVVNGDEVLVKCREGRVMVKELLYIRDSIVNLGSVNEAHGRITIPQRDVETIQYVAAIVKSALWVQE